MNHLCLSGEDEPGAGIGTGHVPRSVFPEILNYLKLGIIVLDRKSRAVCFQNPRTAEILGNRVDVSDYDALSSLFLLHCNASAHHSRPVSEQRQLRLGDDIIGYTIYHPFESFTTILFQDITEKARLESIAEAVEATNNLGYVFSQIRHELGNPANSIKMTLEVLRNNIDAYSRETILNYVDRALVDLGRVEYLLKSLRNFSLYEDLDIRDYDMHTFMKNYLSLVKGAFQEKGISLVTRIDPVPLYGLVDYRALQQVMLNLLSNAVDAVRGVEFPEIAIGMKRAGKLIVITFEDNGCGIPEHHMSKLFTAFFTSKAKGTGLGLPIAAKMLAKMNSTIHISSEEAAGTTVTVSIPEGRADGAVALPDVFEKTQVEI
jgi:signal transduction histidine kinase